MILFGFPVINAQFGGWYPDPPAPVDPVYYDGNTKPPYQPNEGKSKISIKRVYNMNQLTVLHKTSEGLEPRLLFDRVPYTTSPWHFLINDNLNQP